MKRFYSKILAMLCCMTFAMNASAQELMPSYKCEGHKYNMQEQNWNTVINWTTETGIEAGFFGDSKVFYNLFPTDGIFEGSFGLEYSIVGNKVIIEPTIITFYDSQHIVCALDADDLRNGGTGEIIMEVGEDGSLAFPADRKNHSYGYFICTMRDDAFKPAEIVYPLLLVSGITFTAEEQEPVADLTGEVREVSISKNASWSDYTADEGWFQIFAGTNDYLVTIDANTNNPSGEFTDKELDPAYTYISVWNGKEYQKIKSAENKAKITIDEETGVVVGELWVREWTTGIIWHATLTHDPAKPEPLTYDEESDIEVAFSKDDITSLEYENGAFTLRTFNDDRMVLDLCLFSDTQDEDIKIPEGTYPLSLSGENGTAMASSGVIGSSVTQSYVATVDNEGYLDKLWFLVKGDVTVKKVVVNGKPSLSLEINAINSLSQKVKVTVTDGELTDGIKHINSYEQKMAHKVINKGRLIIKTPSMNYSVDGKKIQ